MASKDFDLPVDLGHGIGPSYLVNTEGFSWDFDFIQWSTLSSAFC